MTYIIPIVWPEKIGIPRYCVVTTLLVAMAGVATLEPSPSAGRPVGNLHAPPTIYKLKALEPF